MSARQTQVAHGLIVAIALLILEAASRALTDGTISVPPGWAWIVPVAGAALAAIARQLDPLEDAD